MPESSTDKRVKQSNKIIKSIDKIAEKIKNASEKLKDRSIDKTISVNKRKKAYVASTLVAASVDSDLQKIIKDTNKSFEDFAEASQKYLIDNYEIKLTKSDINAISRKSSSLVDDLVINTSILQKDIQSILTQNLAKGIPERQLIRELKELYPAYSRNASTIINTGMSRLFTDINVSKFQQTNFNWYIWAGPDDEVTRDIPCKHWVWHRFPASQLATITATRLRLWNCRHSIIPIPDEEKDQYPVGNISFS
jgi:hypothetical protein